MKSTIDQKIEDAFYYAVNFYNTNDRNLEKQRFCLDQMMKYGLDLDTCIRIQNPVMSVFQMGELMEIGSELTQQHLTIITNNIRQHLLSIQPTMQPDVVKELPNIPTLGGAGQGGNKRDIDGVSVQIKNVVQDITINGYKGQKILVMSNYDLEPHDMNYLSGTMPSNSYNFTLVDFSHNPRVGAMGVDYLLKGAPGISSIQQGNHDISLMYQGILTRPNFNIVKLNLENCNIGDIGADILGHALVSGKLPATKNIDVSGNNFTLNAYSNLIQGVNSDAVSEDLHITTYKTPLLKDMIDFIKKAADYIFKEHAKKQDLTSKEVVAIYGEKNTDYCKKWLSGVGQGLSAGIIKEIGKPETINLLSKVNKDKNPYPKLMVYSGIFIRAAKDAKEDIFSTDLFKCIGAVNSNNAMNVEEYQATIIGKDGDPDVY
ncbi:MAG: hypothetical protein AB8B66_02145 [Rickettsiaceae bacterium]